MYLIEDGIPMPKAQKYAGDTNKGPRTELTLALDTLQVGQSILLSEHKEYLAANNWKARTSKKYGFRKMRGGWRVWRTE